MFLERASVMMRYANEKRVRDDEVDCIEITWNVTVDGLQEPGFTARLYWHQPVDIYSLDWLVVSRTPKLKSFFENDIDLDVDLLCFESAMLEVFQFKIKIFAFTGLACWLNKLVLETTSTMGKPREDYCWIRMRPYNLSTGLLSWGEIQLLQFWSFFSLALSD